MKIALQILVLVFAAALGAFLISSLRPLPAEPITAVEIRNIELPTAPARESQEIEPSPLPEPPPELPPPPAPLKKEPLVPLAPLPNFLSLPPPPPPQLSDEEFYRRFSGSIVQVYCTTPEELFSASGVIVNLRGLFLTNAHVAEIVEKAGANRCQARHGNPADPFAKIEIVFIPDTSVKISDTEVPQRDFAFLRIVDAISSFSAAEITEEDAGPGAIFLTLGYPSEFLKGLVSSVNSNLVFSSLQVDAFADVDGDTKTAEGYVFHGGLILQKGSSGTAIFTREGKIAGLIFATTKGDTTAERDGIALMTSYMNKILKLETGQGLAEFIAGH
ncbi:MAG: trypsin-like peptidase domain-containing protein [Candidatus Sungbacteria bacterium]|uniref:Trypsin-like peptidase domain-containing protein n=1 Tax=Candidatus Sungiibacteriota bacterium TaxID=2750080 RepID=A0A932YW85_9BACT|nr:trypsin-like peptidase domain-containing protein [Candidatus Sungbacteria bacterium]